MQSSEFVRFNRYVSSTTKLCAQPKRLALFAALSRREHASAAALVAAVGGNTKDRVWVAQAMRDGEIVLVGGVLTVPSARETAQASADGDWAVRWAAAYEALLNLSDLPEWRKVTDKIIDMLEARRGDVLQAQADHEADPTHTVAQHLRLIDHDLCTRGRGHCEDEDCPGRQR
jgi:hypothetical protein